LAVVKQNIYTLEHVMYGLKNSEDFMLATVKQNGFALAA